MRRTKIIASLGPASDSEAVLKDMIHAGMDVARINLSHGSIDDALERYRRVRKVAADVGRPIGILGDLPGPKVRAGTFGEHGVALDYDRIVHLVPGNEPSTDKLINVDYDRLLHDVRPGDRLIVGDGGAVLLVDSLGGDKLAARVVHGGVLKGRPGIHIPADRLHMSTPTDVDLKYLDALVEADIDMIAVSFVRSAHDIRRVGTEPHPRGPLVVAKIETKAAIENLDGIINASGAIMVARGDLGAELPIEDLPHLQKRIIGRCIALGRPAITATQMLESMVNAPAPTRAEASDVANAVFDGTSCVMLSGETAVGNDPANVVRTMARIAERADQEFDYAGWTHEMARSHMDEASGADAVVTDAMTMAAWRVATEVDADAIIAISGSGFTVRAIARFRPEMRILGYSTNERTVRQLTMSWGATPALTAASGENQELVAGILQQAKAAGDVRTGDIVAVLAGNTSRAAATDTLRLVRVP